MKTIVEPKEYIDNLWGKPQAQDGVTYRMMLYVKRLDYDGNTLLYNVVTGQLVVLEQDEIEVINDLPRAYHPVMEQLINKHYLVQESFDEHQYVNSLRKVLKRTSEAYTSKGIMHFTILPTTACNARCYYCFEQGIKPVNMTEETAETVINFICEHCVSSKNIAITWFGGEPTVSARRIDQICEGLRKRQIHYSSQMITNGYLLDQNMVDRAKSLWNLYSVQISVDGTESSYNKIKAYVNADENPYQRVMNNIGLLIDKEIQVNLRMNFDKNNYSEFKDLVDEVSARYGGSKYINVRAHPINGEYCNCDGVIDHATDEWFGEKIVELNDVADLAGLFARKTELPCLRFYGCMAASDASVTITPDGNLVNCPEHLDKAQYTGNIKDGVTNISVAESWKQIADYPNCAKCFMYPYCIRVTKCSAEDKCNYFPIYVQQLSKTLIECYNKRNY